MTSSYPGGLDSLSTSKADATVTATDHPAHHNDLADAINKIEAELGTNPSGAASTVATRMAVLDEAPLNVMMPRTGLSTAVGDDSTNDTTAIQERIDLAYSSGGGDVLLPPRHSFKVTQLAKNWTTSTTVNLIGGGKKSTYLKKFGATTTPVISFSAATTQLETYSDMRDFAILGVGKVHDGIQFDANARLRLTNVDIRGCDKAINNLGGLVMVLTGCNLQLNNDGLVNRLSAQVGGPPPNLIVLSGCVVVGNTHRGIDHGRGSHLIIDAGTDIESNGTAADLTTGGLYIQNDITTDTGFGMVQIRDAWFEGNLGRAIQTLSGDLIMDGVHLLSSESGRAVVAAGCRQVVLRDCHAPSTGDTVSVGTTTFAAFEDCVIHTLTCTATNWYKRNVQGSGANTGAIMFNGDTEVRRWGANVLETPGTFFAGSNIIAALGGAGQVAMGTKGPASQPGFTLGSGETTKLYEVSSTVFAIESALQFPLGVASSGPPNDSLFKDTATSKLTYKDSTGGLLVIESRGLKLPVRVAAPININTASPGATIDGVTMAAGDRVLLANQTTPSQNGVYTWAAAASAMTRATDSDTAAKLTDSLLVTVDEGTTNKDSIFTLSTNKPITLGTTGLRFTRIHPAAVAVSQPAGIYFAPANAKIENMPRAQGAFANVALLATGTVRVFPLGALRAGDTLSALNFRVATTGSATITNSWAGIARLSDRVVLAISATSTATTAAQGLKTFTFGSAFTADKDELLVGFLMYQATTVPTLHGVNHGDVSIMADVPIANGTSNTGATTPVALGATLTAFTADTEIPYCYAT